MVKKIIHVMFVVVGAVFLSLCAGALTFWLIHWIGQAMALIATMQAQTAVIQSLACL